MQGSFLHFSTCTNDTPLCIGIIFDFFSDIFRSQEKLQAMILQNLGGGGGGGVKEMYYGF